MPVFPLPFLFKVHPLVCIDRSCMALGHLATSFLVVACVLFRAPDVSQVHLEPDGIRIDFPERAQEALSCSPCSSVAWECEPGCLQLLQQHEFFDSWTLGDHPHISGWRPSEG